MTFDGFITTKNISRIIHLAHFSSYDGRGSCRAFTISVNDERTHSEMKSWVSKVDWSEVVCTALVIKSLWDMGTVINKTMICCGP